MNIKGFLLENAVKLDTKKVVISNRFKDEQGKPIEWELKALTADDNDQIERQCYVNVAVQGQKGQYVRELDKSKYTSMLLAQGVVYPDLNNAELQDSYHVKTPHDLLKKMLTLQEYNKLAENITNSENMGDLVEQAKN